MRWLILVISWSFVSCSSSFQPKEGDLLFQDIDCGDFCESIEKVTFGYKGSRFSHVGIYTKREGKGFVLEAISAGVVLTPLDSFLSRTVDAEGNPKVIVGRFRSGTDVDVSAAVRRGIALLGKPYDQVFDLEDDTYYCSELVYFSFLDSKAQPVFEISPMTFVDPDSGKTFHLWQEYYDELDMEVPEGEAGLNPGSISRSPLIEVVHLYGEPDGYGGGM